MRGAKLDGGAKGRWRGWTRCWGTVLNKGNVKRHEAVDEGSWPTGRLEFADLRNGVGGELLEEGVDEHGATRVDHAPLEEEETPGGDHQATRRRPIYPVVGTVKDSKPQKRVFEWETKERLGLNLVDEVVRGRRWRAGFGRGWIEFFSLE